MDVDHKASLGSFGGSVNTKKRPISFRLTVPPKRRKLPYEQRSAATNYRSFYVDRDQYAAPDTPTSTTATLEEDTFYDSDGDTAPSFFAQDSNSHYSSQFEHDSSLYPPMFASSAPKMVGETPTEYSSSSGSKFSAPLVSNASKAQARLKQAYESVESKQLFKDCPMWSALLEAKQKGCSGTAYLATAICEEYLDACSMIF